MWRETALQTPVNIEGGQEVQQALNRSFSVAMEKPRVEQVVPRQPVRTTWSKCPCAALEEPMVRPCMRPEGNTVHGEHLQEQGPGQCWSLWGAACGGEEA